jgi:alpha-glucosidase (family GH31 glycosyl hydrolase)
MNYEKFKDDDLPTYSESRIRRRPHEHHKKSPKHGRDLCCLLLLILILTMTVLFVSGRLMNLYTSSQYANTFRNIQVSSRFEDKSSQQLLPEIELKFTEKNIRVQHRLIHGPGESSPSSTACFFTLIYRFFLTISNFLYSELETNHYIRVFDQEHKFQFQMKRVPNKLLGSDVQCHDVSLLNRLTSESETCIELGNASWFGGHESYSQPFWPINEQNFDYVAYITGFADEWGAVIERYWVSTSGLAFYVKDDMPLFVRHNISNKICFKTSSSSAPYKYVSVYPEDTLNYTVCHGADIKSVHMYMIDQYLGKPLSRPDETMMKLPIFTTWSYFFQNINQSVVLDYANDIISNGFAASQLEIDDKWEKFYGDLDFDRRKFPDPKAMTAKIHSLGMRVTLWVHPFCNFDSPNFIDGTRQGYWIKDPSGQHSAWTAWWDGLDAVIIDTTNPSTVKYFTGKLDALKAHYGIDSFKFDAGETAWIPKNYKFFDNQSLVDQYAKNYVDLAASESNFIEVRVAHGTQKYGIFYRILDRATDWTINDGIKSVLTETLQFGLLGYPFVLPDIINGNGHADKQTKELYIRWTQLTAFLPAMQFGVPPWFYDDETTTIAKAFVDIHVKYVFPYMIQLPLDGQPLVRPIWWLEPTNSLVFNISDEFLVGNDILVAPVLDQGIQQRNVYFPVGNWTNIEDKCVYQGPLNTTVPVQLNTIPYYFSDALAQQFFNLKALSKCQY